MNSSQLELDVSAGATDARVIKNVRQFPVPPFSERAHRVPKPEKETAAMESLCTFGEAAKVLGISLRQFRRLVDGGKIAFVQVSERSPRIRPSELQRFLAASVVKYSEVKS
jgi:excisionase family DNA binding protein